MIRLGAVLLFVVLCVPRALHADPALDEVEVALQSWRLDRAGEGLRALSHRLDEPRVSYLMAKMAFLEGKYEEALERMNQVVATAPRTDWVELRDVIESTHLATQSYERHRSPSGRFEIAITPGVDRVLIEEAFVALDAAYDALAKRLGHRPSPPVRIEVYPKVSVLAQVSPLTEEEIRASGTIALCKYNRLMITSPRALLRGYPWVDTLVHEFVHYVVNQRSNNRVPIWMHEGIAKYLEGAWRDEDVPSLPTASLALLKRRLEEGKLIGFEQMHPSMAKLPTQEDASVAFSEVFFAMKYLEEKAGPTAFVELLQYIADGHPADRAFGRVLGTSFAAFEAPWKEWMATQLEEVRPQDASFAKRLVFRDTPAEKPRDGSLAEPEARDHFHLGELLQARDRYAAAVVEYQKAKALAREKHPELSMRLARSLVELSRHPEAIVELEPAVIAFPEQIALWILLGRAYAGVGRLPEAKDCLLEAFWINPFDPEIHRSLADVYRATGDVSRAAAAEDWAAQLSARGQR